MAARRRSEGRHGDRADRLRDGRSIRSAPASSTSLDAAGRQRHRRHVLRPAAGCETAGAAAATSRREADAIAMLMDPGNADYEAELRDVLATGRAVGAAGGRRESRERPRNRARIRRAHPGAVPARCWSPAVRLRHSASSRSSRWRRVTRCRRSTTCATTSRPAA